jgi:hypothetical protein
VYDRYSYDTEKQIALEAWARALSAILNGTPSSRRCRGDEHLVPVRRLGAAPPG